MHRSFYLPSTAFGHLSLMMLKISPSIDLSPRPTKLKCPLWRKAHLHAHSRPINKFKLRQSKVKKQNKELTTTLKSYFPQRRSRNLLLHNLRRRKLPSTRMRKTMKTTIDHQWIIHHCEIERMLSGSKLKNKIFRHTYGNRRKGSLST